MSLFKRHFTSYSIVLFNLLKSRGIAGSVRGSTRPGAALQWRSRVAATLAKHQVLSFESSGVRSWLSDGHVITLQA